MSKKYTTNFLEDTNGSTGSANQVLVSTAAGIDWVDGSGSGIIGGPYLPLSGGTLTGSLAGTSASFTGALSSVGYSGTSGTFSASVTASGNSNSFGDTITDALTATSGTFTSSVTAAGNSNSFGSTTFTGNVGIGTTSPSQKLEVVGNIQATGTRSISSSFDANHYMRIESNSSGGILKGTDGGVITTLVRTYGDSYFNGGDVGIGTTAPSYKLDVAGEVRANNLFRTTDGTNIGLFGSSVFASNVIGIGSSNAVPLVLGTAATERMRITSSGNVGIGTTNPSSRLEVYGTDSLRTHFNEGLRVTRETVPTQYGMVNYNGGALNMIAVNTAGTGSVTKFMRSGNGTSLDTSMVINSSGNVGIGTTSPTQAKLVVSGNVAFNQGDETMGQINPEFERLDFKVSDGVVDATPVAMTLREYVGGARLGIGTTSPGYKLDVYGQGFSIQALLLIL